jgi:hypothetical protein
MHVVVNIVAALMILGLAALGLVLAYLAASCQCECTVEEGSLKRHIPRRLSRVPRAPGKQ